MSTGEHAPGCLRHHHCTNEPQSRNKSDDYHWTTGQRRAVHSQHGTLFDHTQSAVIRYYMDKTFKNTLNENKPDTTMSYMTTLI